MYGESGMPTAISPVRHFFVVNPVCFDNRLKMESVIAEVHSFFNELASLQECNPPDYAVYVSRFPRDAISAIHRFANAVPGSVPLRVYAMGGDGILFDCLNGVVGLANAELGVIPYGKINNFYHFLGENKKDIFISLKAQTCAPSVPMDALYCGSNYALNYCLIGLEALARKSMRDRRTFMDRCVFAFAETWGINALYLTSIVNFEALKQNYRIWVNDESLNGMHAFINIVNSPCYARGKKYATDEADPTDGWLDVLISSEMTVQNMYKILNYYIKGNHAEHPQLFTCQRAKKIFLTSNEPLIFDLDGEVFYDKYISVEIKPNIVRIIDPKQA